MIRPEAGPAATPQGNLAELIKLQGAAIVREHGEPLCPSAVTRYLQDIDPRLFMRAFPFPSGWEWAMCERWADGDGRRQSIQSGETPADRDFDVIGYVPTQLKITSAEEAMGFLVQSLRGNLRSRPDFQRYLERVEAHNAGQAQENVRPIMEYAQELAQTNAPTLLGVEGKTTARVYQSEPVKQTGTKRAKGVAANVPKPQGVK